MLIFITYNRKQYNIADDDRGWVSKKVDTVFFMLVSKLILAKNLDLCYISGR